MAKELIGKVTSVKMRGTIVVSVENKFRHPKYHKVLIRHKNYKAHVEEGLKLKVEDKVKISETRPYSKEVSFRVIEKLQKKV